MIRPILTARACAALLASALPAVARINPRLCTDLSLSFETDHGGGMRIVSAVVRNVGTAPFYSPATSSVRIVWHGENGSTLDFPFAAPLASGAQVSMIVGMWPNALQGTLQGTLQIAQGATRDCTTSDNSRRLGL